VHPENRFLGTLPPDVARRCVELGTMRTFGPGDVIALSGTPAVTVHFPTAGAVSEVEEGLDGGTVEVTTVGFEGVSGIASLLDAPTEPFLRVIEVPTTVLALSTADARALRDRAPALHAMIHRYAFARLRGAGITIGCNARHAVHARLARWLLRMNDRVGHGDFELTHETVARMLGVRRPTVTRAVALLKKTGAIGAGRHSVRIVSRTALETHACSCYPDSRDLFDEIYGGDGGRKGDI
jgi:CRP-like cAMP-binding protein